MTTLEIPHLAKGQTIEEYSKIFAAAGAALKPEQLLACLPVYIHRTEGEKKLAFTAASKNDLKEAFKFLADLIDGAPCVYTEYAKFFSLLPKSTTIDGIRSYFFELWELASKAKVPSHVCLMRFLTNVPGGKKLFDSFQDDIKDEMDDAAMAELFKKLLPKLLKNSQDGSAPQLANDSFMYPVEQSEVMPVWARELQDQVSSLRERVESKDSGYEGSVASEEEKDVFAYDKNFNHGNKPTHKGPFGNSGRPKCDICKKRGHVAANCYQRICDCCQGKGHDAEACPSRKNGQPKKFTSKSQGSR